ncbi:MAG TPA: GMC family oxidoreductase [Myxococcales bacterium]|nr:GMC family oxidoreductase [Myxococcales bacterium]
MSDGARVGRVFTGDELTRDSEVQAEVCIVGSGSGGGVLAHELAARGLDVVLLEEGGYHTRREFKMDEAWSYPNLYQEMANRGTDDLAIKIFQGRSVGGGTTINWTTCFRTPPRITQVWREKHGLQALTDEALRPHFEAVEHRLHIHQWPLEQINANNKVLWDGCEKLGLHHKLIRRNVHKCANLGYCGVGCPVDAKQSMLVTYIPDAVEKGLRVYANASARRLELSGSRVSAVHAEIRDPATDKPRGVRLVVRAKVVAVCGGAINSPALLLRSGLDQGGRVGRRTFLHPTVVSVAMFDEEIAAYSGAPQSVYSHQWIQRGPGKIGWFTETAPIHPVLATVSFAGFGADHRDLVQKLPHLNALVSSQNDGMLPDETGATVKLRGGADDRLSISYDLRPEHFEAARASQEAMARIQLAAGARKVITLHESPVVIESEKDLAKLDSARWERLRIRFFSAHQMGGCPMGADPERSVVTPELRFRGVDNLFVVDGSIFPTSLGVNPQQTIFGLAHWGAQFVAAAVA